MTITFMVAVKDAALGLFANPINVPSIGIALRSFTDETNRAEQTNQIYQHPEDFELWVLAEFSNELGTFSTTDDMPRRLARGKDVIQPRT